MTFEQFRQTRQWSDDLAAAIPAESFDPGARGNVYLGDFLYIEETGNWPATAPGHGKGRWYLRIANAEYQTDDLESLERRLYDYAIREGFCEP